MSFFKEIDVRADDNREGGVVIEVTTGENGYPISSSTTETVHFGFEYAQEVYEKLGAYINQRRAELSLKGELYASAASDVRCLVVQDGEAVEGQKVYYNGPSEHQHVKREVRSGRLEYRYGTWAIDWEDILLIKAHEKGTEYGKRAEPYKETVTAELQQNLSLYS